jgi:hypothetical protein
LLRGVAVSASITAACLAVGTIAFAAGAPVPRPARAVAHGLGLPVDSPALVDAKSALDSLRSALEGTDDSRVRRAIANLEERLADLDSDERDEITSEARQLLRHAGLRVHEGTNQQNGAQGEASVDEQDPSPRQADKPTNAGPAIGQPSQETNGNSADGEAGNRGESGEVEGDAPSGDSGDNTAR